MPVVRRGGVRRRLEERLVWSFWEVGEELMEIERLCARARLRRARARAEAVVSGEGGSPNMKNLMKAPMRITTDS